MAKDYEHYIHIRATADEVAAVEQLRMIAKEKQGLLKLPSAASVVRALIREALEKERKAGVS